MADGRTIEVLEWWGTGSFGDWSITPSASYDFEGDDAITSDGASWDLDRANMVGVS